jgi:hypothetical protein
METAPSRCCSSLRTPHRQCNTPGNKALQNGGIVRPDVTSYQRRGVAKAIHIYTNSAFRDDQALTFALAGTNPAP